MAAKRQHGEINTASQILDVAERLVQSRGFNAFSYADVASELGITKPALHYHFASKAALGEALIARYAARFNEELDRINSEYTAARSKLETYAAVYEEVLARDRMCLCGMLAADYPTLPPAMRKGVIRFFDHHDAWLTQVLEQGRRDGTLRLSGSSREAAQMIIGTLEGAMLVARASGGVVRFHATTVRLIAGLASPAAAGRPARRTSDRAGSGRTP